jgi:hypothetical protein
MSSIPDLLSLIEQGGTVRVEALRLFAALAPSALHAADGALATRALDVLLRVLAVSDNAGGELCFALTALVNLSAEPAFEGASAAHADALALALVPLVSQRLKDATRAPVRRLASTLLANLSTTEAHTDVLCGADDAASDARPRLKRLLTLCTAVPDDESLEHVATVLQNCSRRQSLRTLLLHDDAAPLVSLAATVSRGTALRRRGVAQVVRNVFVDETARKSLAEPRATLTPLFAVCATERDAGVLSAVVDVAFLLSHAEASHATLRALQAPDALRAMFDLERAEPLDPTTAERASFCIRELTKPKFIFAPDAFDDSSTPSGAPAAPKPALGPDRGRESSAATAKPNNHMDELD